MAPRNYYNGDYVPARYSVHRAASMSNAGRKAIADWLRKAADDLEADGHNYSDGFVGRYVVPKKEN